MLIVGAGGLAAQLIDDLELLFGENLVFWSETDPSYSFIKNSFRVIKTDTELSGYLKKEKEFILAIGNPLNREVILSKLLKFGGVNTSLISPRARISKYSTIEPGCIVLQESIVEAGVTIKSGCIINTRVVITHGSRIGELCEIGPNTVINGDCVIGNKCFIGSGAVIIQKVRIGDNVKIGAGAAVIRDIPDSVMVAGVPAVIKKILK